MMMPTTRAAPIRLAAALFWLVIAGTVSSAVAEVRFGHGVYVGGHDFSNQTYDRNHRGIVHLYERTPPHAGCAWHPDGRGGRIKICHLRRIRSPS